MKLIRPFLFGFACALALRVQAETAAPPSVVNPPSETPPEATASVDEDYADFQILRKTDSPGSPKEMGVEKYLRWLDELRTRWQVAGLKFYENHPADPRRWEIILTLITAPPFYAKSFGPDVDEKWAGAAVVDEQAKAAWEVRAENFKRGLLASTDATLAVRESLEWSAFGRDFSAQSAARRKGDKFDYSAFPSRFVTHVAKYAQLDSLPFRAQDYLGALEQNMPGASAVIWKRLLDAPNAKLREMAAERLSFFELTSKPIELSFTAADAQVVDLTKWRGKVVLVDFWATWCGPCVAELPNVKKVYAAYHDKGFEVVGISLENARLAPKDTAEQTTAKLAKAKKVLMDFTAANDIPWPQYFDGKFWRNEISTQYGINSIPAMFLLDQEGKVVTTNARGERLEAEVKRLLNL